MEYTGVYDYDTAKADMEREYDNVYANIGTTTPVLDSYKATMLNKFSYLRETPAAPHAFPRELPSAWQPQNMLHEIIDPQKALTAAEYGALGPKSMAKLEQGLVEAVKYENNYMKSLMTDAVISVVVLGVLISFISTQSN